MKNRADEKASASASVSPSATASASASTVVSPSASAEVKNEKKADQKVSTAKNDQKDGSQQAPAAQDQLGGSSSVQAPATEQPSPESTRFANCSEVAAAGLAPIPSSHPDFRKQLSTAAPPRTVVPPRMVAPPRRTISAPADRAPRTVSALPRRAPLSRVARSVPRWLIPAPRTCSPWPAWEWWPSAWVLRA